MKKITFIILAFIALASFTFNTGNKQQEPQPAINWVDIVNIDSLVKSNPKPVFIDIRADWCGMCRKFDATTLKNEEIISLLNDNYYAVHFNFHDKRTFTLNGKEFSEMSKNGKSFNSMAKHFNATGLPTFVFLNKDLNELETHQGFIAKKEFKSILEKILEEN